MEEEEEEEEQEEEGFEKFYGKSKASMSVTLDVTDVELPWI